MRKWTYVGISSNSRSWVAVGFCTAAIAHSPRPFLSLMEGSKASSRFVTNPEGMSSMQSKTASTSGSLNVLAQYIHIPGNETKVRDHCEHGGSFLLSLPNNNSLLCPSQPLNT